MVTRQDLVQLEKLMRGIIREKIETESENMRTELSAEVRMARMQVEDKNKWSEVEAEIYRN